MGYTFVCKVLSAPAYRGEKKAPIRPKANRSQKFVSARLVSADGFDGAFAYASATVYTGIGVDDVLRIAFLDCVYGARVLAGAAHCACIRNYVSHIMFLHVAAVLSDSLGLVNS